MLTERELQQLRECTGDVFDGSDVLFDVEVGATVVAADSPVSAVRYAKYADQVGYPDCPVGYAPVEDLNFASR